MTKQPAECSSVELSLTACVRSLESVNGTVPTSDQYFNNMFLDDCGTMSGSFMLLPVEISTETKDDHE